MAQADDAVSHPVPPCPTCGEPMMLLHASNADDFGPRHMEFECVAGHRVVVELHETDDDEDLDLPYNER